MLYAPLPDVLVCCCSSAVAPERAGAWARGVLQQVQPQRVLLLGSMQVCLLHVVLLDNAVLHSLSKVGHCCHECCAAGAVRIGSTKGFWVFPHCALVCYTQLMQPSFSPYSHPPCVCGAVLHMQAEQYRGEADASQELLAFLLRSTPLRQQHEQSAAAQQAIPYLPSGSIVSGLPAALLTHAELTGLPAELLVVVDQVPSLVPETLKQLAQLVVGCLQSAMGAGGQPGSAAELAWAASLAKGAVVDAARLKLQRTAYRPSSVYS